MLRGPMQKSSLGYALELINKEYKIVLEFGVWKGTSISLIRRLLPESYEVFGFDSFQGMPDHESVLVKSGKELEIIDKVDYIIVSDGENTDTLLKAGVFSTGNKVPDVKGVTFIPGWFDDTLPEFVKNVQPQPAALIHIDCDHYESTKTVFKYTTPYIKADTILVFDEWQMDEHVKTPFHEKLAFEEWVEENNVKYEFIEFFDKTAKFPEERKIVKILSI
jgi:hypothetical protein